MTFEPPPLKKKGENQWEVEAGIRVDAMRTTTVTSLPPVLALHLRRFTFDFNRMQRVKIQDEFDFPPTLDAGALLGTCAGSADGSAGLSRNYHLFAILVHQGTAAGGHYYAFIKTPRSGNSASASASGGGEEWYEFNDAHVRKLSREEVADWGPGWKTQRSGDVSGGDSGAATSTASVEKGGGGGGGCEDESSPPSSNADVIAAGGTSGTVVESKVSRASTARKNVRHFLC